MGAPLTPRERERYDRDVAAARAASADASRFEADWAQGRSMPIDDALATRGNAS